MIETVLIAVSVLALAAFGFGLDNRDQRQHSARVREARSAYLHLLMRARSARILGDRE